MLRRFAVRRKGVGTILGAAYFIIIVLAIFNLIMWEVYQYDAYQQLVSQMNQVDQDRISESLEFVYPIIVDFNPLGSGKYSFNLIVRNIGGITVNTVRLYFSNCSDTSSKALTIIEKGAGDNCFTNGFINPGETNHLISVVTTLNMGLVPPDGSRPFAILLATERGRTFSTFYPLTVPEWGGNVGYIDIGPLRFVFDYYSLNYTTNVLTPVPGQQAWIVKPYTGKTPIMFWVKVINIAKDGDIRIKKYSVFNCIELSWSGASGKQASFFIVDSSSTQPGVNMKAYNEEPGYATILPRSPTPTPPQGGIPVVVKFGARSIATADPWWLFIESGYPIYEYLVLMGFYYVYKGQDYGVTIPFVAIRTNTPT